MAGPTSQQPKDLEEDCPQLTQTTEDARPGHSHTQCPSSYTRQGLQGLFASLILGILSMTVHFLHVPKTHR